MVINMFLLQDNKLYVNKNGLYVGVNLTPTNVEFLDNYTTSFKTGDLLTAYEVKCKFKGNYKFPVNEVIDSGRIKRTKKITKSE